jgi:hypothetical protein
MREKCVLCGIMNKAVVLSNFQKRESCMQKKKEKKETPLSFPSALMKTKQSRAP